MTGAFDDAILVGHDTVSGNYCPIAGPVLNVNPDRQYASIDSDQTLSTSAHKGKIIRNTTGLAALITITVDPDVHDDTFHCRLENKHDGGGVITTVTNVKVEAGEIGNGQTAATYRFASTFNAFLDISISPEGEVILHGSIRDL